MRPVLPARLSDARFNPVAQDVAFEFGEDRKHSRQGSPAGRGQVERFAQRDEADLQRRKLLQGRNEVYERASSAGLAATRRSGRAPADGPP